MAEEERKGRPRDASGRFVSSDGADDDGRDGEEQRPDDGEEEQGSAEREQAGGGNGKEDISDTPAPSIGPHSVVEREPVEVRLARHEQSEVDAMGEDKRRQVVGKTYGPTFARQAVLYGIVIVIAVAIGFGIKMAVDHFDQPPDHFKAEAPWAQPNVKQRPPKPLQ